MKYRTRFLATVAALVPAPVTAGEQEPRSRPKSQVEAYIEQFTQARDRVQKLAFDPSSFFVFERGRENLITIRYHGDEMGAPVYSLAIREGCLASQSSGRDCTTRRTARMVRATAPPGQPRPRMRGFALMQQVLEADAVTREQIAATLDNARLEWVEADLAHCPAAAKLIQKADEIAWVPAEVHSPDLNRPRSIVLHADMVQVTFATSARQSTYVGHVAEGSPARWAVELVDTLEPCWRPSAVSPPWRR